MKKFTLKLLFFTVLLTTISNSSLLAKNNVITISTDPIERFETPNSWIIKFSNQRSRQWEKTFLDMGADDSEENSDNANTANKKDQPNGQANQPAVQNSQSLKEGEVEPKENWIKWFKKDQFPVTQQSNVIPPGISKSEVKINTTILGVKGSWKAKGFNWLAIEPKKSLYTPEYPLAISLWVWGSNFEYDVYITVENESGYFYNLYLGTLNYSGWRNLKVNIPNYVFPSTRHSNSNKLRIVRIKIIGTPEEDEKGFYAYFNTMYVMHGNGVETFAGNVLAKNKW